MDWQHRGIQYHAILCSQICCKNMFLDCNNQLLLKIVQHKFNNRWCILSHIMMALNDVIILKCHRKLFFMYIPVSYSLGCYARQYLLAQPSILESRSDPIWLFPIEISKTFLRGNRFTAIMSWKIKVLLKKCSFKRIKIEQVCCTEQWQYWIIK
jgi:hypothetical protein